MSRGGGCQVQGETRRLVPRPTNSMHKFAIVILSQPAAGRRSEGSLHLNQIHRFFAPSGRSE
jgi:hypothetical protein